MSVCWFLENALENDGTSQKVEGTSVQKILPILQIDVEIFHKYVIILTVCDDEGNARG